MNRYAVTETKLRQYNANINRLTMHHRQNIRFIRRMMPANALLRSAVNRKILRDQLREEQIRYQAACDRVTNAMFGMTRKAFVRDVIGTNVVGAFYR